MFALRVTPPDGLASWSCVYSMSKSLMLTQNQRAYFFSIPEPTLVDILFAPPVMGKPMTPPLFGIMGLGQGVYVCRVCICLCHEKDGK